MSLHLVEIYIITVFSLSILLCELFMNGVVSNFPTVSSAHKGIKTKIPVVQVDA